MNWARLIKLRPTPSTGDPTGKCKWVCLGMFKPMKNETNLRGPQLGALKKAHGSLEKGHRLLLAL
jgi:hypothetical protein